MEHLEHTSAETTQKMFDSQQKKNKLSCVFKIQKRCGFTLMFHFGNLKNDNLMFAKKIHAEIALTGKYIILSC